ncbi:hypothetical protein [Laspinema palackyanum]|uniref:hypothetical protein n=1 Tax=Laspinema palackyanum TaxID=3231601 RepID=UPI00345D633E|nr:hypothetical protein [Laspinema sp. D2c]
MFKSRVLAIATHNPIHYLSSITERQRNSPIVWVQLFWQTGETAIGRFNPNWNYFPQSFLIELNFSRGFHSLYPYSDLRQHNL